MKVFLATFSTLLITTYFVATGADPATDRLCQRLFPTDNATSRDSIYNNCSYFCDDSHNVQLGGPYNKSDNTVCGVNQVCYKNGCYRPEDIEICNRTIESLLVFKRLTSTLCGVTCYTTTSIVFVKKQDGTACGGGKTCYNGNCLEPSQVKQCQERLGAARPLITLSDLVVQTCKLRCFYKDSTDVWRRRLANKVNGTACHTPVIKRGQCKGGKCQ